MQGFNLNTNEVIRARQDIARGLAYKTAATSLAGVFLSIPTCRHFGADTYNFFACGAAYACWVVDRFKGEIATFEAARINISIDKLSPFDRKILPEGSSSWKEGTETFTTLEKVVQKKIAWLDGANVLRGFFIGVGVQIGAHDAIHFLAQRKEATDLTLGSFRFALPFFVSWLPGRLATALRKEMNNNIKQLSAPTP